MKQHFLLGACLLLTCSVPCLAIDPIFVPVGPELRPYGETACCNRFGAVKMAADGSFVVLWNRNESGVHSSWVRRFAADGSPLSAALEVPFQDAGLYYHRNRLSSAPDGSFVLLLLSSAAPGTGMLEALLFQPSGQALTAVEVAVTQGGGASVGHDGQGNFVVVWSDQQVLRAARFGAAGNPLGPSFEVSQALAGYASVQIAVAPNGSFTAFYEKRDNPETDGHLHRRRFDAAGQALGAEEPVPPSIQLDSQAAIAADAFAAAVFSDVPAARGQFFDAAGAPGPTFSLWDEPNDIAYVPLIASLENGDFAAAVSVAIDNLDFSPFLERFGRDGQEVGPRILLAASSQDSAAGALASSGDRVVVFATRGGEEPFLQIYEATLFADSFESGDLSAWAP